MACNRHPNTSRELVGGQGLNASGPCEEYPRHKVKKKKTCHASPKFRVCLKFRTQNHSISLAHRFLVFAPCSAYIPAELNKCCTEIKTPGRTTPWNIQPRPYQALYPSYRGRCSRDGVLEMDRPCRFCKACLASCSLESVQMLRVPSNLSYFFGRTAGCGRLHWCDQPAP